MSRRVTPDELADAIEEELTLYRENVEEDLREATRQCVTKLVKKTRATAPKGKRGTYAKKIAADFRGLKKGAPHIKAIWYVKAPEHRLTHLLVHGHATRDGGRTKADPFLENALNEVLPEFERAVEEAVKND